MAKKILVETSARHVHLTDEHLKVLFGADAVLHKKKDLSQPGQFASEERVDVVGPKKTLARVSVLGPTRKQTQVELSMTDARSIGIDAPIRPSFTRTVIRLPGTACSTVSRRFPSPSVINPKPSLIFFNGESPQSLALFTARFLLSAASLSFISL